MDSTQLLERLGVLSHPCDLDLLIFFANHPRCLLASESLAAFLGYEPRVIADSLETLMAAGLLRRRQTPKHAARLYVLAGTADTDGWLPTLMTAASTRIGRLALRQALTGRPSQDAGASPPTPEGSRPGPRRVDALDADSHRAQTD